MSRTLLRRSGRLVRQRTRGQSIPLIALMVVILFAMVGLSVDVGNTFAQERKAVAAGNAAAIAGMDAYIKGGDSPDDAVVREAIENTLDANDIIRGDENDQIQYKAWYLDSKGDQFPGGSQVGGGNVPPDVSFIKVQLDGRVNTFFARITGRNDLPLGSTAYSGRCPPTSGVYPIGLDATLFNDDGNFAETDQRIDGQPIYGVMDGYEYFGKTWRRIYIGGGSTGGQISFLRWNETTTVNGIAAASEQALINSLSGDGNLDEGFEEVPTWPSTNESEPPNYPSLPNQLGAGDWVFGGPNNLAAVSSLLNEHQANGTYMMLLPYNNISGSGAEAKYKVGERQVFVIKATGSGASGSWIELIAMGDADAQGTSCAVTPPSPGTTYGLKGNVGVFPVAILPTPVRKPIQYMVVLDVSGSMSASLDGKCNNGGPTIQCEAGPNGPGSGAGTGQSRWYNPVADRRIAVAKESMERLIELMNMPGNVNYDATVPQDEMAIVAFHHAQTAAMTRGWSSDPVALKNAVLTVGANGENYRTLGGTNGAAGLYKASQLLRQRPASVQHSSGRTFQYQRVVVYITDGVAKDFFDPNKPNFHDGESRASTYPASNACSGYGDRVLSDAECQTNQVGGEIAGKWANSRPITQMIKVSKDYIKDDPQVNAKIFVIALANIPATGLRDGVASFPDHYYQAVTLVRNSDGSTNVDRIMEGIYNRLDNPECEAEESPVTFRLTGDNAAPGFGVDYPTVGVVKIKHDQTGDERFAPIVAEAGPQGESQYVFTDLQPGTYRLSAEMYFRSTVDGAERLYNLLWNGSASVPFLNVTVPGSNAGFDGVTDFPIEIKFDSETYELCPAPPAP
jgi:hypothetical protein